MRKNDEIKLSKPIIKLFKSILTVLIIVVSIYGGVWGIILLIAVEIHSAVAWLAAIQRNEDSGRQSRRISFMGDKPLMEPPRERVTDLMSGIVENVDKHIEWVLSDEGQDMLGLDSGAFKILKSGGCVAVK